METRHSASKRLAARVAWLALVATLSAGLARADDDARNRVAPVFKRHVQECAACHVAYPPGMLPAESWRRVMSGLAQHHGTDASIDPKDIELISQWLVKHADASQSAARPVPQDRITRTDWFVRQHRHIEAATWRLPSVRSAANCMACHAGADRGRFGEHELRIPEGLGARQRANWGD